MKLKSQRQLDLERKTFRLTFPSDLAEDRVIAMLRVLGSSIHPGIKRIVGMQTIVFETHAGGSGITHRMIVPWQLADRITSQLRHQIPGIVVEEDDSRLRPLWTDVMEVGMTNGSRQLAYGNSVDLSTGILTAASQALTNNEAVVLQWVITPASYERPPSKERINKSTNFGIVSSLLSQVASGEEIDDRRRKLDETNFLTMGRIGAVAKTEARAKYLTQGIFDVLKTADSYGTKFTAKGSDTATKSERLNKAMTPWLFPGQLNVIELAAVAGFPLGSPFIPGLPRSSSRHLYATEEVARTGRVFGKSNYPGHSRPVAQDYKSAVLHSYIGGKTGHGKSVFMANCAAQDMWLGYGAIVFDASNSDSPETLFNRALSYIPRHRLGDVIIMDFNNTRERPVGFNILDQGLAHMAVDHVAALIQKLYPDSKGVWTPELIHHGLYALIEHGNATLMDLITLLRPSNETEKVWVKEVIRSIKDRQIRQFWEEWMTLKDDERRTKSQPLYDRLWQFNNRPEIHNVFGQTKSAFQMRDVLKNNMILLVNLAGLPEDTAAVMGSLLFHSLWTTAQSIVPDKENFVYLDEIQQLTKIPVGLEDMTARGRKHKFALTMSTQYLAVRR